MMWNWQRRVHDAQNPAAGGNSGIGFESGKKIAAAGGHVILAVRSDDKGEE